jgi:hypothetical protein
MTKTFWISGFCLHLGLVLLIAVSAYLGILPTHYKVIPQSDFFGHAILIGMLAFFLDGSLDFRPLISGRMDWLRLGPALSLTIAAIEEVAQVLSPNRTASLKDFAGDVLGIVLCSWLAKVIGTRRALTQKA